MSANSNFVHDGEFIHTAVSKLVNNTEVYNDTIIDLTEGAIAALTARATSSDIPVPAHGRDGEYRLACLTNITVNNTVVPVPGSKSLMITVQATAVVSVKSGRIYASEVY